MTVALLALLVVVAGVVVAVVLRRLPVRGMDDAVDSASFSALPAGSLTAADVDDIRFDQAFRGYRMGQVDEVLDRFREHLVVQEREIDELRRRLESGAVGTGGALSGPAAGPRGPVPGAGDHDHTAPFDSLAQDPPLPRRPVPAPTPGPGAGRTDSAWSGSAGSGTDRPDPVVSLRPRDIPGPTDRWVDDRDETRWFSQAHRAGLAPEPPEPYRSEAGTSWPPVHDVTRVGADPSWPAAPTVTARQPDPSWPPVRREPAPSPTAGPAGWLEPQQPARRAFTPPPAAEAFSGIDLTPSRPRRRRG